MSDCTQKEYEKDDKIWCNYHEKYITWEDCIGCRKYEEEDYDV